MRGFLFLPWRLCLDPEHTLKLVKVNYDEEQELATRYGVQSLPNIVLFENGMLKAQTIGARPKAALEWALGLVA